MSVDRLPNTIASDLSEENANELRSWLVDQSFADVDFSSFERGQSPGGLLRRLDSMSCQGCHQSRGLAG